MPTLNEIRDQFSSPQKQESKCVTEPVPITLGTDQNLPFIQVWVNSLEATLTLKSIFSQIVYNRRDLMKKGARSYERNSRVIISNVESDMLKAQTAIFVRIENCINKSLDDISSTLLHDFKIQPVIYPKGIKCTTGSIITSPQEYMRILNDSSCSKQYDSWRNKDIPLFRDHKVYYSDALNDTYVVDQELEGYVEVETKMYTDTFTIIEIDTRANVRLAGWSKLNYL